MQVGLSCRFPSLPSYTRQGAMRSAGDYNQRRSEISRTLRHVGSTVHGSFCCLLTYSQINADSDDNCYSANTMLLREGEVAFESWIGRCYRDRSFAMTCQEAHCQGSEQHDAISQYSIETHYLSLPSTLLAHDCGRNALSGSRLVTTRLKLHSLHVSRSHTWLLNIQSGRSSVADGWW
jgi:hypothetical protein